MTNFDKVYLFRITHIDNMEHINKFGITHFSSRNSNINFRSIGDNKLIETRKNFLLNSGNRLGDYIPFYFGVRTPMLYVLQHGYNLVAPTIAENIVYCVSTVQKIIDLKRDFVFTDGHAIDRFSAQYNIADIENIDSIIDWKAVKAKYWKDEYDLDRKRKKEAEFLVLGDIPADHILRFIVSSEKVKNKLIHFGGDDAKIEVRPDYYF
jgi:ssDNA thymidine ADP-ribosyltransferase, DarT